MFPLGTAVDLKFSKVSFSIRTTDGSLKAWSRIQVKKGGLILFIT